MDKQSFWAKYTKRSLKNKDEKEPSPEELIRFLQGVFCTGRYRSWVATQGNGSSKKVRSTKKHPKSTFKE